MFFLLDALDARFVLVARFVLDALVAI